MPYDRDLVDKYQKIQRKCEATTGVEHAAFAAKLAELAQRYPGIAEQAAPKSWRDLIDVNPDAIDWLGLSPEDLIEARDYVYQKVRDRATTSTRRGVDRVLDWMFQFIEDEGDPKMPVDKRKKDDKRENKPRRASKKDKQEAAEAAIAEIIDEMEIKDGTDDGDVRLVLSITADQQEALAEWDEAHEALGFAILEALAQL